MPQSTLDEILGGGQQAAARPRPMTLDEIAPEKTAPGPIRRFVGGAAEEVKNIVRMPYEVGKAAIPRSPEEYAVPGLGLARRLIVEPAKGMFSRAGERFKEGRYSEAAGYAGAGLLPLLGPAAASIGEQAGEGDIAGAAGRAVVLGGLPLIPRGVRALRGEVPAKPSLAPTRPEPLPVAPQARKGAVAPQEAGILEGLGKIRERVQGGIGKIEGQEAPLRQRLEQVQTERRKLEQGLPEGVAERRAAPKPQFTAEEILNPARISESLSDRILADVKTIRETGTIDETLKPEARVEARQLFGGRSRLISLETVGKTQQAVTHIGEEIARLRKASGIEGSPGQNHALQVAEETGKLLAERLLSERRQWGLIGQKYQTPVQGISEAALAELEKLGVTLRRISRPGLSDKIYEFWVNSLLSGPLTHIVNTTSNTLVRLSTPVEKGIGAGIDFLRAKITGTPQEVRMGEAAADIYGAVSGLREGIRNALQSFKTEEPIFGKTRIEAGRPKAIPGVAGRIIRLPGRSLLAADEFMKAINLSAEKHSLAYRQAAKEGKVGWQRAERIGEILKSEPKELTATAKAETAYRVFQQDFGPIGSKLAGIRATTPGVRYVVPFLRTPINIAKYSLERTPLNVIRILDKVRKGELKGGQISSELAKPVMGSLIGAAVMQLVSDGYITGSGPKEQAARRVLYDAGWQPYSLKVGEKYYSFSRFEPIGSLFGIASDLKESWDELPPDQRQEMIYMVIESVSKNITSKTYMTGLTDALNTISDPERFGENWIQRFAGSVVPTGLAQIARAIDPVFRKPGTVEEAIKARVPFLSRTVPERTGVFGQPAQRGGTAAERFLSPSYVSEIKPAGSVEQELARLKMSIGETSRRVAIRGQDVEITQPEYRELNLSAGRIARPRLEKLFATEQYLGMSEDQKRDAIESIVRQARSVFRDRLRNQKARELPTLRR